MVWWWFTLLQSKQITWNKSKNCQVCDYLMIIFISWETALVFVMDQNVKATLITNKHTTPTTTHKKQNKTCHILLKKTLQYLRRIFRISTIFFQHHSLTIDVAMVIIIPTQMITIREIPPTYNTFVLFDSHQKWVPLNDPYRDVAHNSIGLYPFGNGHFQGQAVKLQVVTINLQFVSFRINHHPLDEIGY